MRRVLGPSQWRSTPWDSTRTPMDVRRDMKRVLEDAGAHGILMEDEEDRPGERLRDKFRRLASSCQAILCYWLPDCIFDATEDELVLLDDLADHLLERGIPVVLFVHPFVASPRQGGRAGTPVDPEDSGIDLGDAFLHTTTPGAQSAYFGEILHRLPCQIKPWSTHEELLRKARDWWGVWSSVLDSP